jgi:hypothetical protein
MRQLADTNMKYCSIQCKLEANVGLLPLEDWHPATSSSHSNGTTSHITTPTPFESYATRQGSNSSTNSLYATTLSNFTLCSHMSPCSPWPSVLASVAFYLVAILYVTILSNPACMRSCIITLSPAYVKHVWSLLGVFFALRVCTHCPLLTLTLMFSLWIIVFA